MLTLSRYLRVREKNGNVVAFHDLHADPIYCTKVEWDNFARDINAHFDNNLFSGLQQRKLIIASKEDDDNEFNAVALTLENKLNQPTILYLMMAQGCNFNCGYCPVPNNARKYGDKKLSFEDAVCGINLWAEHLKKVFNPNLQYFIIFYGGEPLLNKEVIERALAYIDCLRKRGDLPDKNINLMISTNGVLFDGRMIELCRQYGISVAVGIDGPKKDHNRLRLDTDGQDTHEATVSSIELLVKSGIRVFASASITPYNIDYIADCFIFFREIGVEKFGFNFLKSQPLLDLIPNGEIESYFLKAARLIIESARTAGNERFEYQMERKFVAFENLDFFPVDCTCYGNQLVIQPDGQVSNCPFFRAGLGNVRELGLDFRISNTEIVKQWRKRLPLYNPAFCDMDAKSLCGPGCAWSSYDLVGNFSMVDIASKTFSEEVFNELIWSGFKG